MRRPLALAVASLTFGFGSLALVAHGCGGEPAVEDVCGWLGDEDNCYRRFAEGVATPVAEDDSKLAPKCGVEIIKGEAVDTTGAPLAEGTKPTTGAFLTRDKLDVCILTGSEGGQIVFDPPFDPNLFPPTGFAFKMINGLGKPCGSGSFADSNSFSIGFDAPEEQGGGGAGGSGAGGAGGAGGSGGEGGRDTSPIFFGTFSIAQSSQRDVVDTVCPNEEAHHFNLNQLDKCERFRGVLPTAEVDASSGAIGVPGYVRLRVLWPLTDEVGYDEASEEPRKSLKPVRIEYFDCSFPGPTPPCNDGVLDGAETDVDCGKACGVGCEDKQGCIVKEDCLSRVCVPNEMGIKKCVGNSLTAVCVNDADSAVLADAQVDVDKIVSDCGENNGLKEPETFNCIQSGTGLSADCAQCYDDAIQCTVDQCKAECLVDEAAQACVDCKATKCDPAFVSCRGIP